jgi:hypothetical protein
MQNSWAEMTIEEKLETLHRDVEALRNEKANLQNVRVLGAMVDGIGDAVKTIEKKLSQILQERTHSKKSTA